MIYQFGVLLFLGSAAVTSALPPCVCTRILRPVCGSDGQTYANECLLECAQFSNRDLNMANGGPCGGGDRGDECVCTLEYNPVCGTDGKSYPNPCAVTCPRQSPPVSIAHYGDCRTKRENRDAPSCTCPRNFDPICASDDKTYDNMCVFECFKERNPELRLKHAGFCELSQCPCTLELKPVCGSDGNTYPNPCTLKCGREINKDLEVVHMGECASAKVAESCLCTRESKPVCGTDGNTYGNPCMLNCARVNNENLHIDHVGACEDRVKVVEIGDNESCACARNLKPVCASNGVTFTNECLMKCAGTHLTVSQNGPCE